MAETLLWLSGSREPPTSQQKAVIPQTMSNNYSSSAPTCVAGTRGSRNRHISDRHIRRLFRHINNYYCPGKATRVGVSGADPWLGTENIQRLTKTSDGWFALNCYFVKRCKNYHRLSPFHPLCPLAAFIYKPRRGCSWRHDGRQADRHADRQARRRVPRCLHGRVTALQGGRDDK